MSLERELHEFYGTDGYYRISPVVSTVCTQGVKYFIEKGEAHWAILDIALRCKTLNQPFVTVVIKSENGKATFTYDDGNDNVLSTQHYKYTDLEEGKYKFYVIDDVVLLPSEY